MSLKTYRVSTKTRCLLFSSSLIELKNNALQDRLLDSIRKCIRVTGKNIFDVRFILTRRRKCNRLLFAPVIDSVPHKTSMLRRRPLQLIMIFCYCIQAESLKIRVQLTHTKHKIRIKNPQLSVHSRSICVNPFLTHSYGNCKLNNQKYRAWQTSKQPPPKSQKDTRCFFKHFNT